MHDGFLWGVATAAYQVEGGLNGPGEPLNNWAPWDRSGAVEPCGTALRFWDEPERLLDLAAGLGVNALRLSIEWARVQPSPEAVVGAAPRWDEAALDRYGEILAGCYERGMEPVVTLHHFTHPLWCGLDFWLRPDAPERLARYARRCSAALGERLEDAGHPPVGWWVTCNEPAIVPLMSYLLGMFPGTGRGPGRTMRAFDHVLAAHVLAYDAVHEVYAERGWDPPLVSMNPFSTTLVDLDAVTVDLLLARERGVGRSELPAHLARARSRARRRMEAIPRRDATAATLDAAFHGLTRLAARRPPPATVDALYRSPRPRKLDYLALDHYDPVMGHYVGPAPRGGRGLRPVPGFAPHWEQRVSPDGLAVVLRQAHLQAPDRPILVAENGLATPGRAPRPDGWTRERFLEAMCAEVLRARDEGIAVCGYLHWTLADNYEWGSYMARFGLYGVERTGEGMTISETDATGADAAGAFREIVRRDRARGAPDGA